MTDLFTNLDTFDFIKKYFGQEDWYMITRDLKELIKAAVVETQDYDFPDVRISGAVHIGQNCNIGRFVVIEGPAFIGDNVEIGSHAHIRAGSVISDNCVVGYTAGVKNSLMMSGAKISNHTFLGDSIMFNRARLGGHAETGNRRFDQGEIAWHFSSGEQKTGLDKLGAIIGEDSRIGGAVMLAPGCVVGKNTFVSSGINVNGYVPDGKFVKAKIDLEIRENSFKKQLNQSSKLTD